ncbi:hypothetical protein [Sphingobacterium multivorum]|uniref:hypothetical protein n=1 Tax=Sphingobacterium multivorum TaxID=28454 RepID=UPI0031BA6251
MKNFNPSNAWKWFIHPFLAACLMSSCSKTEVKEEGRVDSKEIQHKTGEGALFVGSNIDGKYYQFYLKNKSNSYYGSVGGRSNNKALKDCSYQTESFGFTFKVPEGEYVLEITDPMVPGKVDKISINIESSKCKSFNINGTSW